MCLCSGDVRDIAVTVPEVESRDHRKYDSVPLPIL